LVPEQFLFHSYPSDEGEQAGKRVKRRFRLTRSTDIKRVRRLGKSYAHPLIVLITSPNPDQDLRIGVAAGVTVGKAVQRNRAKRQIRACLDELIPSLLSGWDVIVLARQPIGKANYPEIRFALKNVLQRAGLLVRADRVNDDLKPGLSQ
jgi:ribonuclease P protein component